MTVKNKYLLKMDGLLKHFPGVQALDNVKLYLKKGTVHALVGENGAGKSTLMKCLFGIYKKDSGNILFDGKNVEFVNPKQAIDNGISMVHQELNQVPDRSIMENIWLGRFPMKGLVVDEKEMYIRSKKIFDDLSININPKQKLGSLSVSERQIVDIAKALSGSAKIIVFDEPTSSLTEKEIEHLFKIINTLKETGCGIIYISHKMDEILYIADDVTVMRDGRWVITERATDLSKQKIISYMVGRDLFHLFPPKGNVPGSDIALSIKGIKGKYKPNVVDVSFDLYKGEILGISGLMGARKTELVETIFGLRKLESGEIYINGEKVKNVHTRKSIENGFGLVTEERRKTGIFSELDLSFNSMIANIENYCNPVGLINNKKTIKDTKWVINTLKVKTPSYKVKIANLSGGNQQKVILGRWLLTDSDVLMLDEPTKGIDVGAKYEIYQLMIDIAKSGKSIIFVSSELPELLGVADRILVMSNGMIAGIVNTKDTNQEEIMHLAGKFL